MHRSWFAEEHEAARHVVELLHRIREIAVILLMVQAWVINRIAGLDYPVWEKKPANSSATA